MGRLLGERSEEPRTTDATAYAWRYLRGLYWPFRGRMEVAIDGDRIRLQLRNNIISNRPSVSSLGTLEGHSITVK